MLSDSRGSWLSDRGGRQHYWPAMVRDDPRFDGAAIYLGGYEAWAGDEFAKDNSAHPEGQRRAEVLN